MGRLWREGILGKLHLHHELLVLARRSREYTGYRRNVHKKSGSRIVPTYGMRTITATLAL
jgi:hypothetical protein